MEFCPSVEERMIPGCSNLPIGIGKLGIIPNQEGFIALTAHNPLPNIEFHLSAI
jgi:hypothetical protein